MNSQQHLRQKAAHRATRHTALGEAIRWHEGRIKFYRSEQAKARKWSRANNDGDPDLGGTLFTEDYPRFIMAHRASIKAMRELQLDPPI